MTDLISRARAFAINAHGDQRRRYSGEPYWHHCAAVADMVAAVSNDEQVIAAAFLHDVAEDTSETLEGIKVWFGEEVADLVGWLTDVSRPEDGNRAARKALDRAHIAKAPPEAKTIKLADLIDNTQSIVERDPGFAKIYMAEKAALLEVLKEGDPVLWGMAKKLIDEYYSR